jgi:AcrR family transcriptional regulator
MVPTEQRPTPGLRERKKAKTRATIQRHAMRLIHEQGYDATTVEQIAEAAEISPSTFFRYFPTKEDVVLYDDLDPPLIAAYEAQPADAGPIGAMRGALRAVLGTLPRDEIERQWERARTVILIPDLRMRMLDQLAAGIHMVAALIAPRMGKSLDDFEVRALAGAIIGAMMAAILDAANKPQAEFLGVMDASLAYLETRLSLDT